MPKQFYYPIKKGDKIIWLNNYSTKINIHAGTLTLGGGVVTARQAACQAIVDTINLSAQMKQSLEDQYTQERQIIKDNEAILFAAVANDKANPAWTEAIGADLGEIGNEDSLDLKSQVPTLKLKQTTNGWEISFNLMGRFDSLDIARKRPGGNWTFLANDTSSPYVDTEPQVDGTEYRAVYKLGDDKMDNWGPVVSVKI